MISIFTIPDGIIPFNEVPTVSALVTIAEAPSEVPVQETRSDSSTFLDNFSHVSFARYPFRSYETTDDVEKLFVLEQHFGFYDYTYGQPNSWSNLTRTELGQLRGYLMNRMYGPLPGGFWFKESAISIQCKFSRVPGQPNILPDFRIVLLEERKNDFMDSIFTELKDGPMAVKGFAAGIHMFQLAVYHSVWRWAIGWQRCLWRLDCECGIKVSLSLTLPPPQALNIYVRALFAVAT
jgi:hypothetical protein